MPFIQFQFRRGTAAEWTAANTVLAPGEQGIELDTNLFKIGDEAGTPWNDLPYGGIQGPTGPTGPTGPVGDRYGTTSSTGLTIAIGTQYFIVGTGLAYIPGQVVLISYDATNWMEGPVSNYNPVTGDMQVEVSIISGSGTYYNWLVNLAGAGGIQGPTGNTGATGPTGDTGAT